jgi:hypothetical protein
MESVPFESLQSFLNASTSLCSLPLFNETPPELSLRSKLTIDWKNSTHHPPCIQVLVYGSGSVKRAEAEQRVILELHPHLDAAGHAGKPEAVAQSLKSLLFPEGAGVTALNIPPSNPSNAYLLAVVALETSRAGSGPLTDEENAPTPLMHALAYEAAAQPKTVEHAVFTALSQASFRRTAERLLYRVPRFSSHSRMTTTVEDSNRKQHAPLDRKAFPKLEHFATTLISSVAFKGEKSKAIDAPRTTRADEFLEDLVAACPSLFVSQRCLQCWLEQDTSIEVQKTIQSWIARGSKIAPSHVEHLLHRFLISSSADAPLDEDCCRAVTHSAALLDTVASSRQESLVGNVSTGVCLCSMLCPICCSALFPLLLSELFIEL